MNSGGAFEQRSIVLHENNELKLDVYPGVSECMNGCACCMVVKSRVHEGRSAFDWDTVPRALPMVPLHRCIGVELLLLVAGRASRL